MNAFNDLLLSKLAVRLRDVNSNHPIGSGIIYYHEYLNNRIYILTAAHCLFSDGDKFKEPYEEVILDIYNPKKDTYNSIKHSIDHSFVSSYTDKDFAILIVEKSIIEKITGSLPTTKALKERNSVTTFVIKGFPSATKGKEIECIYPNWSQTQTEVNKFQLSLPTNFSTATNATYQVDGFSGSGVFLHSNNIFYLFGIFTRFRDSGKVIYCQYLETINEVLDANFCPTISFTFLSEHGLTPEFFTKQVNIAIKDLGPRFSEELNFRLPIAKSFNTIAKDKVFKQQVIKTIDDWLLNRTYSTYDKNNESIKAIELKFNQVQNSIKEWLVNLNWDIDASIEIAPFTNQLDVLEQEIDVEIDKLYKLKSEAIKKEPATKKDYNYKYPFELEIGRLREIQRINSDFLNSINDLNIESSNNPYLIIQGEAGCGKSHLLADVAKQRILEQKPTLLILGQQFKSSKTVWENVLSCLNASCSKDELLATLENIGEQIGCRVLILIDALNEGAGKELWKNHLNGFIEEFKEYKFIGLVLTVRSSYWNVVVPEAIQIDNKITKIEHKGFKGNEYAALRLFCEHFKLKLPNFPILTPEFSNPLFLQLVCNGVKESKEKSFPQGFQGFTKIFNLYIDAIGEKLSNKREEYRLKPKLIKDVINEIAFTIFNQERSSVLSLDAANELFDSKFPKHLNLLTDLIEENLLIRNLNHVYSTDTYEDVIYFAYERFGDFFIAEQLLKGYESKVEVKTAFKKQNELGKLDFYKERGLLEAFAIILPEKFNIEIFEVYDWVLKTKGDGFHNNQKDDINYYLMNSLKWRKPESFEIGKLKKWFNSKNNTISEDDFLYRIIELTTAINHPFNSDRLYKILKSHKLPERDSFWLNHIRFYNGTDDDGNAFPINRLIDWAWTPKISFDVDSETARLAAQTLVWVLSTTIKRLRDQTTKAMVNLLEEQPEALLSVLKSFKDIDDPYISERLYAIAYGCALRTSKEDSVLKIAQFVFDTIFKNGNPPNHILLRDYARNTIEYGLYLNLPLEGDFSLIFPPYKSKLPDKFPNEQDIDIYEMNDKDPNFEAKYGRQNNKIRFSVVDWDFGRYTIDSALRNFNPVSFTIENEYKQFLLGLKGKKKSIVKNWAILFELINLNEAKRDNLLRILGQTKFEETMASFNHHYIVIENELKNILSETEQIFLFGKGLFHLESISRSKNWQRNFHNSLPIKCWIVKRAFELGYNPELHGYYDYAVEHYSGRHDNLVERIGKKYQWIALYEILGILTDNYKIKDEYGMSNTKFSFYKGTWQFYLRNIDPAFVVKNKEEAEQEEDELGILSEISEWWLHKRYNHWNTADSLWIDETKDLPDPNFIIQKTDDKKTDWLYLNVNTRWNEPKPIGKEKYHTNRKDFYYSIQSFIINKKDKVKIVAWLEKQNFWNRWMPKSNKANLSLLNRENYWSPAAKENQKSLKIWEEIRNSSFKVIVTTSEAVGELSDDKSGAHFSYDMPCKVIFEGMELKYSSNDGEFLNKSGEIIVSNVNPDGILIRKKDFLEYLSKNNFDIVWTLVGEKRSLSDSYDRDNQLRIINGVYYLNDQKMVVGSLNLRKDSY